MNTVVELRKKLITACRILDREGVMDELGHFSARCPDKSGVLINGRVSPGQAVEKDFILLDLDGNKLEGELEPAAESPMHLAVYQKRPDVMAISHTHSAKVITLSICGKQLKPYETLGASIKMGSAAPVFERFGLVNTFELGYKLADTLGSQNVCVLKSHGSIVVGKSIEETCVHTLWVEKAARFQYEAMLLGTAEPLPETEIKRMLEQKARENGHNRTWNYYKWKVTT